MRFGRLLIGMAVILATLWVIVGEQITSVSSDAVVNARLTTVRTPIAGTVEMAFRPFGSPLDEGEILATVIDPHVDLIRLHDLELERDYTVARIERLSRDMEDTAGEIATLGRRAEIFHHHRAYELDVQIRRAQERLALLREGGTDIASLEVNLESGPLLDISEIEASRMSLSLAMEQYETLLIARDAVRAGVFLGDGFNDAPISEQAAMAREAELDRLAAEMSDAQARLQALESRIEVERARINLLGVQTLAAPDNAILWEVLASNGETVQPGQDVVRLMACNSALVTLSVPDVVYNRIRVGQSAQFRLNGTVEVFEGTITRLAGSGAETIYQNLAIAPSRHHLERFDVALLVPELRDDDELNCTVGRTGRVFFERRPLDWFRSASD